MSYKTDFIAFCRIKANPLSIIQSSGHFTTDGLKNDAAGVYELEFGEGMAPGGAYSVNATPVTRSEVTADVVSDALLIKRYEDAIAANGDIWVVVVGNGQG